MIILNPVTMSAEERQRLDRWLKANGCDDHVALDNIELHDDVVEYTAICPDDLEGMGQVDYELGADGELDFRGRKRLKITIPLEEVA